MTAPRDTRSRRLLVVEDDRAIVDAAGGDERLAAGDLTVDIAARRVRVGAAEVHLTRTEFDLLAVLARRCGRVVERDRLLADVWGDRVFERFRRGGSAATGGTGLGLAIARWAIALHGGRIGVVPASGGCRIRADLPAAPGHAGPTTA